MTSAHTDSRDITQRDAAPQHSAAPHRNAAQQPTDTTPHTAQPEQPTQPTQTAQTAEQPAGSEALFLCYQRCTTCAKARRWLNEHDVAFRERDIKSDHPSYEELKEWHRLSGLPIRRFFNTSGQLYRAMNLKDKLPEMSDDEALHLLASDGMLVKRPIIVSAHNILVGFTPNDWAEAPLGTAAKLN